jgi:hypothetical protein
VKPNSSAILLEIKGFSSEPGSLSDVIIFSSQVVHTIL